jgi:4a-hydroxytetrahydrobiopterin dehydratase
MTDTARPAVSTRTMALAAMRCRPDAPRLAADELAGHLATLSGWDAAADGLSRTFTFDGFASTIGFVNAIAWIAEQEDHHPELNVSYGRCRVTWSTHSAGGITGNDVICAAKVERLLA